MEGEDKPAPGTQFTPLHICQIQPRVSGKMLIEGGKLADRESDHPGCTLRRKRGHQASQARGSVGFPPIFLVLMGFKRDLVLTMVG